MIPQLLQSFREQNRFFDFLFPEFETRFSALSITTIRLIIFVLLPTIIFIVIGSTLEVSRAVFMLDYFVLAFLTPWIHRYIVALAFGILLLIDIVFAIAPGFHFTFGSLLDSIASIPYLDLSGALWFVFGPVIIITFMVWLVIQLVGPARLKTGANIIILTIGFAVYIADDKLAPNNNHRDRQAATNVNIASALSRTIYQNFIFNNKGKKNPTAYDIKSATSSIFDSINDNQNLHPRIVLVIVESMSIFYNDKINRLQLSALNNDVLHEKYQVLHGAIPFKGSTVPAELRELCKVLISAVLPDISLLPAARCLPKKLEEIGYHTIAIHGFSGFFFDRRNWYRDLGFNKILFMPDIDQALGTDERCGTTFRASCDHLIQSIVKEKLIAKESPEKMFLYWLTVNGHLPVANTDRIPNQISCEGIDEFERYPALCNSVKIDDSVLRGLVETALDEELPRTLFIIVGDHMAPYLNKKIRATMNDKLVPYIVLSPKY